MITNEESEVCRPPGLTDFLVTAHCCRDWPVSPLAPLGRCGLCGQVPTIKEEGE